MRNFATAYCALPVDTTKTVGNSLAIAEEKTGSPEPDAMTAHRIFSADMVKINDTVAGYPNNFGQSGTPP